MKWWAEITQWRDNTPNGVYLLDDAKTKMYAFRSNQGQGEVKFFKRPLRIDVRGRKFVVNAEQWAVTVEPEVPFGRTWEVVGSRGDKYQITETDSGLTCTCAGFRFRGDCKHLKIAQP